MYLIIVSGILAWRMRMLIFPCVTIPRLGIHVAFWITVATVSSHSLVGNFLQDRITSGEVDACCVGPPTSWKFFTCLAERAQAACLGDQQQAGHSHANTGCVSSLQLVTALAQRMRARSDSATVSHNTDSELFGRGSTRIDGRMFPFADASRQI